MNTGTSYPKCNYSQFTMIKAFGLFGCALVFLSLAVSEAKGQLISLKVQPVCKGSNVGENVDGKVYFDERVVDIRPDGEAKDYKQLNIPTGTYKVRAVFNAPRRKVEKITMSSREYPLEPRYPDASGVTTIYLDSSTVYRQLVIYVDTCPAEPGPPIPPEKPDNRRVKVVKITGGDVGYLIPGSGQLWEDLREGQELPVDCLVQTGPDSEVTLMVHVGDNIVIKQMTQIRVRALFDEERRIRLELIMKMGEVKCTIERQEVIGSDFTLKTPTATAGIRGTIFSVRHDDKTETTTVRVEESEVMVTPVNSSLRAVTVRAGQEVEVKRSYISAVRLAGAGGAFGVLGCFLDNNLPDRPRDLSGYEFNAPDMTNERCAAACRERGFAYAGTQNGSYCFCGNSYGRYGALTSSSARRCDMPCPGDPKQICGGAWANSVYSTAVQDGRAGAATGTPTDGGSGSATKNSSNSKEVRMVWERVGTGDCGGRDVGRSDGFTPDNSKAKEGYTAVCWDGKTFDNRFERGKVFCTYKNVAPDKCTGGKNTGVMYRAVAR